jgi:hypothetical protein
MKIDRFRELLYDYVRGKLSEQDRDIIEKQLLISEELRNELEMVKTYYAAIDETDPVPVPKNFLEKVHQRIDSRGKRSLLNKLLFPLHLKLPIEFAGVAATVALVIYIFIPQLEKKNYSEYERVPSDNMHQAAPTLQIVTPGKPVADISAIKEIADRERTNPEEEKISAQKDEQRVSGMVQQPKSSVSKQFKASSLAKAGVKKVDPVLPASERSSEYVPTPESAPAPVQQSAVENNELNKSEYASAIGPVVQNDEPQNVYSKSEEQTSVSKRKIALFEKKRMKTRSGNAEESDAKKVASAMDLRTTTVSKDITAILAKNGMKLIVKEFAGHTTTCSASGTPAAVKRFLREIKKLPDVTLLKVVPDNFSESNDSAIVEFSVMGMVE